MDQLWEENKREHLDLLNFSFPRDKSAFLVHFLIWGAEFIPVSVSRCGKGEGVKMISMHVVTGQLAWQRGQSINAAQTPAASLQLST